MGVQSRKFDIQEEKVGKGSRTYNLMPMPREVRSVRKRQLRGV